MKRESSVSLFVSIWMFIVCIILCLVQYGLRILDIESMLNSLVFNHLGMKQFLETILKVLGESLLSYSLDHREQVDFIVAENSYHLYESK